MGDDHGNEARQEEWGRLKDAFWAAVDGGPEEHARQIAALSAVDPALGERLQALLAADRIGDALQNLVQFDAPAAPLRDRIGPYEVLGVLGAGGMGKVYRARDVRLQRDVAIKVLSSEVMRDPSWLGRLQREAQVLASFSHPNIAHVYGLEQSDEAPALVMELVDGPTLSAVIARRAGAAMDIAEALRIARQIADALDAAHEKGVVHRDLKPGNVVLTPEAQVKIVDFGLAKSVEITAGDVSGSATAAGVVLGTPAYMSPEQARGLAVDKRTDIWAFGCVLYELLTGRQAFGGDTPSDSLAAVLERQPDLRGLPAATPPAIRSLVGHCLEKDQKRRLRDIADARLAIDDVLNGSADAHPATREVAEKQARRGRRALWVPAALVLAGAAGAATLAVYRPSAPIREPERIVSSIVLPRGMKLGGGEYEGQASESLFAVSPDGRQLAVIASADTARDRLWIRDLASDAFRPLSHTENASSPFWSPDVSSIAFVAGGRLRAIRLSDSTVTTVTDAAFRVGAWGAGNRILFAPAPSSPLSVVPVSGGVPRAATKLDAATGEVQHSYPAFLPDGRHFLYFSMGSASTGVLDPRGIFVGSLDAAEPARLLIPGATAARYANGYVLFVKNGTLVAQPFDAGARALRGAPLPLVEVVNSPAAGATGTTAAFSVSETGVLVYQTALSTESRVAWFDRSGRQIAAVAPPADYGDVALSPDGRRVATSLLDPAGSTRDLWVFDDDGGGGQRVTHDPADDFAPVWSPDGRRLLFSSMANGAVNLLVKDVTTTAAPATVQTEDGGLGRFASDWSHDGRLYLYIGGGRAIARSDLWVATTAASRQARALLDSPFVETHGRFSPDGRWLAYTSNESGQWEVYVVRLADRGDKRRISSGGGGWPRWAKNGSELFYLAPDNRLISVKVQEGASGLVLGAPVPLFTLRPRPAVRLDAYAYDVSPDGQRFVVNTLVEDTTSTTVTLVLNWSADLARR